MNQIPGQSCACHPCSFAAAVLRAAVSLVIPAEGDAGPYRGGNKDGNCFGIFPPAMEMQNAFYGLYGCEVVMGVFCFTV